MSNHSLVGIDRRPSLGPNNGLLYGVAFNVASFSDFGIYTINSITAVATLASITTPLTSYGSGVLGVDFNPVADRLRIVTNVVFPSFSQNFRVNVDTGAIVVDSTVAYAVGDANFGATPEISAVAYNNNFGGATSTVLRDIDSSLDILAIQSPPNDGTLNTQFSLGVDIRNGFDGYDISGLTGTSYATFILEGDTFSGFYTLGPAGATLVGDVTTATGERLQLLDIAAAVGAPVPIPAAVWLFMCGIAGLGLGAKRKTVARIH